MTEDSQEKYLRLIALLYDKRLDWCDTCNTPKKLTKVKFRNCFHCSVCRHHFYPAADTIFQKSSLSYCEWFKIIYNMGRVNFNIKDISRNLRISYKTCHRIWHLIRNENLHEKLSLITEPYFDSIKAEYEILFDLTIQKETPQQQKRRKELSAIWRKNNPDKIKEQGRRTREVMPPHYIRIALRMKSAPPELMELKRAQLRLMREIKKQENCK